MEIKDNIKKLREQHKETLEEVAKAIGSSKQTIQRYETGEIKNIPYDKIIALAKHFGVKPGVIMGWEDTEDSTDDTVSEHIELISKWIRLSPEKQKAVMDIIDALNGEGE